jgi:hypothetical protein
MSDTDSIMLVYGGNTSLPTITKAEKPMVDQTINVCVAPITNETNNVCVASINNDTILINKEKTTFPTELDTFSFANRQSLICGSEPDPSNPGNLLEVAQKIMLFNNVGVLYYSIVIDTLVTKDLRRLAKQFGIKNLGSRTKFEVRFALAEKKSISSRYNIKSLGNNNNSCGDNTKNIIRIINALFHPDNYETFICLNDRKTRLDFEVGVGSNNSNFWALLADYVNDASNTNLDTFELIENNEEYNTYIEQAAYRGYTPIGCSQQTGSSCRTIVEGIIKIRGTIISNMTKSGSHSNDSYEYTDVAIKRHNLVKTVSKFSAYYFFICCSIHPEMDSVLKRYLGNSVKADSSTNGFGIDNPTLKKKENNDVAKLIDNINNVNERFGDHFDDHRKRFADLKRSEAAKEYCAMNLLKITQPLMTDDPVINNRIRELEELLKQPLINSIFPAKRSKLNIADDCEIVNTADPPSDDDDDEDIQYGLVTPFKLH